MNEDITYEQIYKEFCDWGPEYASKVIDYKPCGPNSICVWLNNGLLYKCIRYAENKFTMQMFSNDEFRRMLRLQLD